MFPKLKATILKICHTEKTAESKTSDKEDLNNFVSPGHFKVLEEKEIDEKENKYDKQEDLI